MTGHAFALGGQLWAGVGWGGVKRKGQGDQGSKLLHIDSPYKRITIS
jgi:hypothetical protein